MNSNGKLGASPELEKLRKREELKKHHTKPDEFDDNRLQANSE